MESLINLCIHEIKVSVNVMEYMESSTSEPVNGFSELNMLTSLRIKHVI